VEAWSVYYRNLLDAIQGKAARRILGVFRTAPALPVALEAGLLPPTVRLERLSVIYGMRVRDLPHNHPVPEALGDDPATRNQAPTEAILRTLEGGSY
jgi:hypothetical protein